MGLAIDFFGFRYDEDDGSFIRIQPGWLWHRPSKKLYHARDINKDMAAAGYTPGPHEIGRNDKLIEAELWGYDPKNSGFGAGGAGGPAQPAPAAITAGITGGGTTTLAFAIGGGPAPAAGTLTITGLAVDGTAITAPAVVQISQGATAAAIATKVAAAIKGLQDAGAAITLDAVVAPNGTTVNVTQTGSTGAGNFDAGASAVVA